MMLDDADPKDVEAYCESKYEHGYFGGVDGLHIVWLKPGTEFYIDEYDGAEGLIQKERLGRPAHGHHTSIHLGISCGWTSRQGL